MRMLSCLSVITMLALSLLMAACDSVGEGESKEEFGPCPPSAEFGPCPAAEERYHGETPCDE